jgi:predicted RNase H-like nuclease (RuvC/YqgF family)
MKTIEELEAELETVTRERDKLSVLVELSDGYRRERDEARAKIERMTKDWHTLSRTFDILEREYLRADRERDEARAEVERLTAEVEMLRGVGCCESDKLDEPPSGPCGVCRKCAYRRGAEAMREACASAMRPIMRSMISRTEAAQTIRALPIPEEP